jgi:hypothetical protein
MVLADISEVVALLIMIILLLFPRLTMVVPVGIPVANTLNPTVILDKLSNVIRFEYSFVKYWVYLLLTYLNLIPKNSEYYWYKRAKEKYPIFVRFQVYLLHYNCIGAHLDPIVNTSIFPEHYKN